MESEMTAALLNTYDTRGGAAQATYRLHQTLQDIGVNSRFVVRQKRTDDPTVEKANRLLVGKVAEIRYFAEFLPVLKPYYEGSFEIFSPAWIPEFTYRRVNRMNPDVVHLNWMTGLVRPETFTKFEAPIVCTLHDEWLYTGGCHLTNGCEKYRSGCGRCPQLDSSTEEDLSRDLWKRKQAAWEDQEMIIVTPSSWLADRVRKSPLLREYDLEVIPIGVDTDLYWPRNPRTCRNSFDLPTEKNVVLFGAADPFSENKGYSTLNQALEKLESTFGPSDLHIAVFGTDGEEDEVEHHFPVTYTGYLNDEELSELYNAADVLGFPSKQETCPQTALESLACGTPIVAFDATGQKDLIDHEKTGFLAKPFDVDDFAEGLEWVLSDTDRREKLGTNARDIVTDRYGLRQVGKRYVDVYRRAQSLA